jgi:hypothetical protein
MKANAKRIRASHRPGSHGARITDGRSPVSVFVNAPMPMPSGLWTAPLPSPAALFRLRAEQVRQEFSILAEQWRRDTQHLSQIYKKVMHPAYFRIMGMGERAVPLLLEALRDRPAHWFVALKATTGLDPVPAGASPSTARDVWLNWGRKEGLLD